MEAAGTDASSPEYCSKGGGGMVSEKSESEKQMGTAFGDGGGGGELV